MLASLKDVSNRENGISCHSDKEFPEQEYAATLASFCVGISIGRRSAAFEVSRSWSRLSGSPIAGSEPKTGASLANDSATAFCPIHSGDGAEKLLSAVFDGALGLLQLRNGRRCLRMVCVLITRLNRAVLTELEIMSSQVLSSWDSATWASTLIRTITGASPAERPASCAGGPAVWEPFSTLAWSGIVTWAVTTDRKVSEQSTRAGSLGKLRRAVPSRLTNV